MQTLLDDRLTTILNLKSTLEIKMIILIFLYSKMPNSSPDCELIELTSGDETDDEVIVLGTTVANCQVKIEAIPIEDRIRCPDCFRNLRLVRKIFFSHFSFLSYLFFAIGSS